MNKIIKSILSLSLLFTMVGCIEMSNSNNINSSLNSSLNSSNTSSSSISNNMDEFEEVSFDEFYENSQNLPVSPYKSVLFETTYRTLIKDEEVSKYKEIDSYYLWKDGKFYNLKTNNSDDLINLGIKYINRNLNEFISVSDENKEYIEKYYKFYISEKVFKINYLDEDAGASQLLLFNKYGNLTYGKRVEFNLYNDEYCGITEPCVERTRSEEAIMELKWSLFNLSNIPENGPNKEENIKIWVESETVEFYKKVLEKYKQNKELEINFKVEGVDLGGAPDYFLQDEEKGADILKVPHDSISKLTANGSHIMPLTDQSLIDQVKEDNSQEFVSVITKTMQTSNGAKDYIFAAPCSAQTNFLYYNKKYVSEEQVKTWEGIAEAAKAVSSTTRSCTLVGEDGYNFAWSILARQMPNNTTTLKLYEDKKAENCYFQGDDMIAITKWTQDYFKNPNGFMFPPSSGWELELQNNAALSVITGAWNYDTVYKILGSNLGVAKLPTFTTTEEMGTIPAGTEFQSGSFYDCSAFVMKKNSPHVQYLQEIVKYLTSKEVQEAAFAECNVLPAYKHAATEFEALSQDTIEAEIANIQYEMSKYGIAQPFGTGDDFTRFYYTSGAGITYKELIIDEDGSLSTYNQIKSELANIENIWKTGEQIR